MNLVDEHRGFDPDLLIPPGETIKEVIESLGMTQAGLAARMNRPVKTVNEIVKGKASITADTALQLERVLGAPGRFWLRLESDYQLAKAKERERQESKKDETIVQRFPYAEMAKLGWVPVKQTKRDRVEQLSRFFGVSSLRQVRATEEAAFRKSRNSEASPEALSCWLRQGELLGRRIETAPFDAHRFREALAKIRELTVHDNASAIETMRTLCAEAGVALVFVPHLKRTYVNGAARWLTPRKALIQLSIRNRFEDVFWFSFFHESAHILKHGKRHAYVDLDSYGSNPEEEEADQFARDFLIHRDDFERLRKSKPFSVATIRTMAQQMKIAPAILIGRLQHEKLIPHTNLNGLRRRMTWG